jgi:hypothetical protein
MAESRCSPLCRPLVSTTSSSGEILSFHDHEKERKGHGLEDPAGVAVEGGAAVVGIGDPLGWTVVLVEQLHLDSLQVTCG